MTTPATARVCYQCDLPMGHNGEHRYKAHEAMPHPATAPHDETRANARLIAAAPALLAALETIVRVHNAKTTCNGSVCCEPARAAIRAAKGE